jgi:hypothetical protein
LHSAQRHKREWLNLEEIAELCSELDGSGVPNEAARENAYRNLERDLLSGDFEENGRSRVLYLHPSTVRTRMTPEWLQDAIDYNYDGHRGRSEFLPWCWIARSMYERFAAKHNLPIAPPRFRPKHLATAALEPTDDERPIDDTAHEPELSSVGQPSPERAQKTLPPGRRLTRKFAREFAKSYVAGTTAKGRQPTQKGLEEAARTANLRGPRDFLRKAIVEILGRDAIKRGRPRKKNSPKFSLGEFAIFDCDFFGRH